MITVCVKINCFDEAELADDRASCGEHQWCRECEFRLLGACAVEDGTEMRELYRREFFAYHDVWPNEY